MAEDFVVADGGKSEKKGGDLGCHLEELGLAGEAVGAGVLAEALVEGGEEAGLDGVALMAGVGLAMACLMVTHTMAMAQDIPTVGTRGRDCL